MKTLLAVLIMLSFTGCVIVPQENNLKKHPEINAYPYMKGDQAYEELYPEGVEI